MDIRDELVEGFRARLDEIAGEDVGLIKDLASADEAAHELGRRAADALFAPLRWRQAIGESIDTTALAELLEVSRQAIASRVESGTLLAVPGRRSRLYPTWQIDFIERRVRPEAVEVLRSWRSIEPDVDPLTFAAWMGSASEDLDGRTPAEALLEGDGDEVVASARARAGARVR